jgi:hypothetical protein
VAATVDHASFGERQGTGCRDATAACGDLTFNFGLAFFLGGTPDGRVNLEAITPPPLFTVDDHWWFAALDAARDPVTGVTADPAPPYAAYQSNATQVTAFGNPLSAALFHDRWYVAARCPAR